VSAPVIPVLAGKISWTAPARHRYGVLFDGAPIASSETYDGAFAYLRWAVEHLRPRPQSPFRICEYARPS
jgi:hypothetical protein